MKLEKLDNLAVYQALAKPLVSPLGCSCFGRFSDFSVFPDFQMCSDSSDFSFSDPPSDSKKDFCVTNH